MERVLNQRKALLAGLIGLTIVVHGLAIDMVLPRFGGSTDAARLAKFVLSGGLLYSLIVTAPLWLWDQWLWRVFNPEYNIQGVWEVRLEKIWRVNEEHLTAAGITEILRHQNQLKENVGQAVIRQTPFRAQVQEAVGVTLDGTSSPWIAELILSALPGRVIAFFESTGVEGLFSGYDMLTISKRNWRGRPSEMVGDALHLVKDLDIAVKGVIRYRRVTRHPWSAASRPGGKVKRRVSKGPSEEQSP